MFDAGGGTASQWVGGLRAGPTFDLLLLTIAPDGTARLDRPARYRFQIPLGVMASPPAGLSLAAADLALDVTLAGGSLVGTLRDGDTLAPVTLERVWPLSASEAGRLLGRYRPPAGPPLLVEQDARAEERRLFCVEGDEVVRLYPLAAHRCLSECGEVVTFGGDVRYAARSLTREAPWPRFVAFAPREAAREETLVVPAAGHHLAGTLLLPPGQGPHPTVIFLHHANTHQRDYYRLFAEAFVQRGLAAFIYDKRGWGDSTGAPLTSDIFDLADDAQTVYRFLKAHPAVRRDAIGLWGISNGAWVAPLVASRVGDAAFVVAASMAGVTPARQEQVRRVNVARELGASPRALALLDHLWDRLFRLYVGGQWDEELGALLARVNSDEELQRLPKYPGHAPGLQPVPPVVPVADIRAGGGAWVDGDFDPAPVCAALRCPLLCVWGADDDVVPLEESVYRIRRALEVTNHPQYDLRVLPATTHHLYVTSPQPVGIPAGEMHTRLHHVALSPGVRDLMAEWVVARVSV